MKGRHRIFAFLLPIFLMVALRPALAHQSHAGLTEIVWNSSSGVLEVTHRLYAHDLEPRLFQVALSGWEETPEGIAKVGAYCRAHFSIMSNGVRVPLSYVGAEPDSEFIFIYFTAALPRDTSGLSVQNSLLNDAFDDQVNLVNLTLNRQTQSQYFHFGDADKSFVWQDQSPD